MAHGIRAEYETLRTVAFGSIGAAYAALGSPLSEIARLVKFVNLTDADVLISKDGTNDHDIIPTNGFALYDLTTNKVDDGGFFFADQTQFYQKRASGAPTAGNLYMTVIVAARS